MDRFNRYFDRKVSDLEVIKQIIGTIYPKEDENPFLGLYSESVSCLKHSKLADEKKTLSVIDGSFLQPKNALVECKKCKKRSQGRKKLDVTDGPDILIIHSLKFSRNLDFGKYSYEIVAFIKKDGKALARRPDSWY